MDERNWWVAPGLGIGPFRFGTPRAELRAARIPVERDAEGDGVNLLPGRPRTAADVRKDLTAAGHDVAEEEAALLLPGTGIAVWTARPGPSRPVCAVSVARG
jgi:hypothetical protein